MDPLRLNEFLRNRTPSARANPITMPVFVAEAFGAKVAQPRFEHLDGAYELLLGGPDAPQPERWERCVTAGLVPEAWLPAPPAVYFPVGGAGREADAIEDPAEALIALAALGLTFIRTAEALALECWTRLGTAPWRTSQAPTPRLRWYVGPTGSRPEPKLALRTREVTMDELRATVHSDVVNQYCAEKSVGLINRATERDLLAPWSNIEARIERELQAVFREAQLDVRSGLPASRTLLGTRFSAKRLLDACAGRPVPATSTMDNLRQSRRDQIPDYLSPLMGLYELGLMPGILHELGVDLHVPSNAVRRAINVWRGPRSENNRQSSTQTTLDTPLAPPQGYSGIDGRF